MKIKAYYIMIQDLYMSGAKLAVQIGHGTDIIWNKFYSDAGRPYCGLFKRWITEFDRRKIVLEVETLAKLNKLALLLLEKGIDFEYIIDKGYTEFDGDTITGLVIMPLEDNILPAKIKRLRLWK